MCAMIEEGDMRDPAVATSLLAGLLMTVSVWPASANGPEGEGPATSTSNGIRYQQHYNRNALADAAVVGEHVLALTESGHLLRFSLSTFDLGDELAPPEALTCLHADQRGYVLAGSIGGTVYRIDPESFTSIPVARYPHEVSWVGTRSAPDGSSTTLLAVVRERRSWMDGDFRRSAWFYSLHDQAADEVTPLGQNVHHVYLDDRDRLWLGGDLGEFGGTLRSLALTTGELTDYARECGLARREEWVAFSDMLGRSPDPWDPKECGCEGVYGFLSAGSDGLWVYGGVSHMGLNRGYIAHVVEQRLDSYATFGDSLQAEPSTNEGPRFPITHMHPDRSGGFFVFSYGDVFRTDGKLQEWSKLAQLDVRYNPGRANAVGSYPAVVETHVTEADPPVLIAATARDGLISIRQGRVEAHTLDGQLEASRILSIHPLVGGLAAVEKRGLGDSVALWMRDGTGWTSPLLEPRAKPGRYGNWNLHRALVYPNGDYLTVHGTNRSPGPELTVLWRSGTGRIVARRENVNYFLFSETTHFLTREGAWAVFDQALHGLADDGWVEESALSDGEAIDKFTDALETVAEREEETFLIERPKHRLWIFHHPTQSRPARLGLFEFAGETPAEVRDGLSWKKDELLLATDAGLARLELTKRELIPIGVPSPDGDVEFLARDRSGALWMAGSGLWLAMPDGQIEDLSGPSFFSGGDILALEADPDHPFGAILSVDKRGLLFVRATFR